MVGQPFLPIGMPQGRPGTPQFPAHPARQPPEQCGNGGKCHPHPPQCDELTQKLFAPTVIQDPHVSDPRMGQGGVGLLGRKQGDFGQYQTVVFQRSYKGFPVCTGLLQRRTRRNEIGRSAVCQNFDPISGQ